MGGHRRGEGWRSGRGPVAELLVREAARTNARFYRDLVRSKLQKAARTPRRKNARAAGARVDARVRLLIHRPRRLLGEKLPRLRPRQIQPARVQAQPRLLV